MDFKLAQFSGKAEDFPAWSTKFVALMQTKGLFSAVMGQDDTPDKLEPLVDGTTAEQRSEHETKAAERKKIMKGIKNRNNEVWCNLVLVLDNTTLMCLRNDCFNQRTGFGDGALAWKMLLDRFNSSERPTVVSLVGQLAKLRLGPTEKLDDYFVRGQELMTRLSDAGERISDTLFKALVTNGLPEQYEHFVVQESFQPATTFQELRTRLRNFEDAKRVRHEEQQLGNHVAMHGLREGNSRDAKKGGTGHKPQTKKGIEHITCYRCKKKGHYQRDCKEPESSGSAKTFSASRTGWKLESSFVVDSGCTDHVVNDRSLFTTFEATNIGEGVVNPNGSLADVKGKGTVEALITDVKVIQRMYEFDDVLFVPSYNVNLMSFSRVEAKGNTFIFKSDQPVIQCGQDEALPMCLQGQLYYL